MKILAIIIGIIACIAGIIFLIREQRAPAPEVPIQQTPLPIESPRGDQWFGATTTADGVSFMYPDPFPGRYVTAVAWPPEVTLGVAGYTCAPSGATEKVRINGREYCRTASSEGAAGSTYTTYEYRTDHGGRELLLTFTLRRVQCLNFDKPEQDTCAAEQERFDVDEMADRLAQSVTS